MRMILRALVLTLTLVSTGAFAATDPSLFDLHWRLLGPFRAGRVCAVTGVPGEAAHFYFGSVNGGVWETKDAGRTWQPIFDSQPIGSIGAIAVAPSNASVLYVGSGEADMRSDIAQGNGMYKSADGGKTWSHIGLTDSQQIARIVVHPSNPDVVYVAALGHPYGPNDERGVFRSNDGGATWKKILGRKGSWDGGWLGEVWDGNTGAVDIAFEPGNPNVLYAALWQTRRTPWSVYPPSNGPGSGLFKSTDGGDHWTEITGHGFPLKPGRIGIAVAPSSPQRVYAIVDAKEGGMYRSDDGGANWTRASSDARIWSRGWYFGGVTVEPKDADTVHSINVNVYTSTDGGKNFVPSKGAPGGDDYHQLWIDPDHPERRILGVDQGTVVSVNGGKTWSSWFNQPTGQFYHVITDNRFPYWVYGAQQDSGAAGIPSRTSTIDGISMMEFRETTAGGESDNIAPDPNDPEILYGGRVEKLNTRTHQTQSVDPTIAYPGTDRRTWTLPLVFSPREPRVLYFANQKMYRTQDGGQHWTVISPDLTRENPATPATLDPITAANKALPGPRQGVIYAIAPSRTIDHDIWAGTDDGQIWRTPDEGANWTNVTPAALTSWSKVGIIDASHFDGETAYAAIDRHRLDDFKPYIYRTHDGGKSWQLIANGIADVAAVNVVREDPVRRGMLYAGTERGIYVSLDDGDHWLSLQLNLPITSVRDIDIHGDDVVIATHGRAFWVLDNVTPLRQDVPAGDFLFAPSVTVHERPAGFTGSPMPKDEPMAPNPPFGAYIDYAIRSVSSQPVTIEILDGVDALVRRYSSADAPPAMDLKRLGTAPEWFNTPSTVSAAPGMHRFVWPLHYPAPAGLTGRRGGGGSGAFADGVWAPPGNYKVVLTVNGQKFTQPLSVIPDPRFKLSMTAYTYQFMLARDVEKTRAALATALTEAGALVKRKDVPDALRKKVAEVSGVIEGDDFTAPPPAESSLRFINQQLSKLANALDSADAAPTTDARSSWDNLKPRADAALSAWAAVKAEAPPAVK